MTTRLGKKRRAVSMHSLPSATGSTAKPLATSTSQKSFRLRSLSSTTRMRFVIAPPILPSPRKPSRPYLLNGWLTILNRSEDSVKDPTGVALNALAWVLADTVARERFLALTGLDSGGPARCIGEPATHARGARFPLAHEPDLVAAADALGPTPAAARRRA